MSNNKIFKISNAYMLLCGIDWWDISMEKKEGRNYRYLAKSTTWNQFLLIAYIVFLTKLQKRQIPEKRFALIKKRYHNQLNRY
jgi:hypothetical protein